MSEIVTERPGNPPTKGVIDSWSTCRGILLEVSGFDNWQDLMIEEEEFDTSDNKMVLTIIKHLIVQGAPALEHTQMH